MVRLRRVNVRSPRACDFEICSGRRGDSDDSREDGRANWCKYACEAELDGFSAVVNGLVLSAKAQKDVVEAVFVAARVAASGATSSLVNDCFATDTDGGLVSSVRRLRGATYVAWATSAQARWSWTTTRKQR